MKCLAVIFPYRVCRICFSGASIDCKLRGVGSYKVAMFPWVFYTKVGLNKPQETVDWEGLDIIAWRHSAFQTWGWRRGELFVQDYFQHFKNMTLKSQIVFWTLVDIASVCIFHGLGKKSRFQYFLIKRWAVKPYWQTGKAMASPLSGLPILYKYYTTPKYHVQFYSYIFP